MYVCAGQTARNCQIPPHSQSPFKPFFHCAPAVLWASKTVFLAALQYNQPTKQQLGQSRQRKEQQKIQEAATQAVTG
jgi:hypothetical protein